MSHLHWYAFSFRYEARGIKQCGCTYIGYPQKDKITKTRIDEAKVAAEVHEDAVLLGISYLGKMTRAQMTGGDE